MSRTRTLKRTVLAELPATTYDEAGVRVLVVELSHTAGRGHSLCARVQDERGSIMSFELFNGCAYKRLDAERFNAKRFASYNPAPEMIEALEAEVLNRKQRA